MMKHDALPWRNLITNVGSPGEKHPASGWRKVGDERSARGGAEVRCIAGTGTTIFLGIETCTDPRSPDSGYITMWTSGVTANGIKDPDAALKDLSSTFPGKLYWRWVWVIYTSSGNGWACVSGWGETSDQ